MAGMGDIPDIKKDLPMSMTMAAFAGISWYIGAEINTSLFLLFKRRRGLYFWSCALSSWGVILQPLFIILADFSVWKDLRGAITMVLFTWALMVVPHSWVLYSRLHLLMHESERLKWIMAVLIFTSVVFTVPTVVIGILAQLTPAHKGLYNIWDRIQLTVFFVQETLLSALYIYQTRKHLRSTTLLVKSSQFLDSSDRSETESKSVLHHLIYTNILVIILDIALLGIQYADQFYLQGAFKPCVYGVKLKLEFVILNRLVKSVRRTGAGGTAAGEAYSMAEGRAYSMAEGSVELSGSLQNLTRTRSGPNK
ncbi:integral membrane protein [Xylariaceae sp. FL0016]|nr:integral membrane protein [Xylariaceae sp. FL0016]